MRAYVAVILVVVIAATGCIWIKSAAGKKVFAVEQVPNPSGETACNLKPGTNRYTTTVHLRYYVKATEKGGYVIDDTGHMRGTEHRAQVSVPEEVLAEAHKMGASQLAPCVGVNAATIERAAAVVGHRIEGINETHTVRDKYGSETVSNMLFYEVFLAATVVYDGGA